MKFNKISTLAVAFVLAVVATGCSSAPKGKQLAPVAAKNTNFLGIVTVSPKSYNINNPNTDVVSTSDIGARRDFSGTQTTLLWGLIAVDDY